LTLLVLYVWLSSGEQLNSPPLFIEIPSSKSQIAWAHDGARSQQRYLPEAFGPGVAIFDFDNDGWMDILFVNSGPSFFYRPSVPGRLALYRNNRDGTFTDVTEQAGFKERFFGMGAAAGDYDGDGYTDIYITGFERSYLYHNRRNGTFEEVAQKAGVVAPGWSTSALWFDYDNDGKLDLFVPQFVDYSSLRVCTAEFAYGGGGEKGNNRNDTFYCIPRIFDPRPSRLFHNNGDGTFTDVSKLTGISGSPGKGLGAVATDVNNDGFLDLFQANDTMENFLFVNRQGKTFEEHGLEYGVAYSQDGKSRSGMGVDSADLNGDGWQDLFVANIAQETFSLYRNESGALFSDISAETDVAHATRLLSGWGLRFFDYDNDGWPDLLLANGHPDDKVNLRMPRVFYREPLLLFHNDGSGRLRNVSPIAGEAFRKDYPARALAVGDLNNDGYLDVVIGSSGEAPLLLLNTVSAGNHWIGLRLRGKSANPDGIGAIVRWSAGGKIRSRLVTSGGSYLSSHDPRIVLGIGSAKSADWVEVRWPGSPVRTDRVSLPPVDRYVRVVEGQGIVSP
jgi:hypothetical protein